MSKFEQFIKEMRSTKGKEMLQTIGVPTIYNLKNLKVYEKRINELTKSESIPFNINVALSGFFLGETIVKNIKGAKWKESDSLNIYRIPIDIPVGEYGKYILRLYPFDRAVKFIDSPTEYDFLQYYKMLVKMRKNKIDLFNQPQGEWVNHGYIQTRTTSLQ